VVASKNETSCFGKRKSDDSINGARQTGGERKEMSIFNPGLDLYDLEKCQCENCKKKEQEKNEKDSDPR
jgi:hypothetical protein